VWSARSSGGRRSEGRGGAVDHRGHQSLPIRLLPAADEEPIAQLLARSWPETTTAAPAGPITAAAFPKRLPKGGVSLRLLQGDGSTRRLVRAVRGAESRILVLPAVEDAGGASIYPRRGGPGIPDETATFAYVAAHLERLGVPVPRIYALDPESRMLLLEDLGDTLVYDAVLASRVIASERGPDSGGAHPGSSTKALHDIYEEALDILRRMQAPPPEPFDPARTLNPDYDAAFICASRPGTSFARWSAATAVSSRQTRRDSRPTLHAPPSGPYPEHRASSCTGTTNRETSCTHRAASS